MWTCFQRLKWLILPSYELFNSYQKKPRVDLRTAGKKRVIRFRSKYANNEISAYLLPEFRVRDLCEGVVEALPLRPAELESRVLGEHVGRELRRAPRHREDEAGLPLRVGADQVGQLGERNAIHRAFIDRDRKI